MDSAARQLTPAPPHDYRDDVRTLPISNGARPGRATVLDVRAPCEFDCVFCTYDRRFRTEPSLAGLIETMDAATNRDEIVLSGPDPLGFPNALSLLRHAASTFRKVIVQTPGSRLSDPDIWDFVTRTPSIRLHLPLYSHVRERHESVMRGVGTFDMVVRMLAEHRVDVRLHTIVLPTNIDDLDALVELAHRHLRPLGFRILAPFNLGSDGPGRYVANLVSQTDAIRALKPHLRGSERGPFLSQNRAVLLPCILHRELGLSPDEMPFSNGGAPRMESEPCPRRADCSLASVCPGISPHYLARLGTTELQPV